MRILNISLSFSKEISAAPKGNGGLTVAALSGLGALLSWFIGVDSRSSAEALRLLPRSDGGLL